MERPTWIEAEAPKLQPQLSSQVALIASHEWGILVFDIPVPFWPAPIDTTWNRGLIWKDPDAGKNWGQEEKGVIEDEMVGWHHWLDGHGFGWTPGVGDGEGGLVCCGSWGCKESEVTELKQRMLLPKSMPKSRICELTKLFVFWVTWFWYGSFCSNK